MAAVRGPWIQRMTVLALGGALASLLPNTSRSVADIIRWQDLYGGFTMTQQQCASIPEAVWVTPKGYSFCMRYYLSAAGGQGDRPVVFLSGDAPYASTADRQKVPPPDMLLEDFDTNVLVWAAERMSREQRTTAIYLARVGLGGSSGTHHTLRHTMLELLATSAALDEIKQRHSFEGFHVYGHSGGGNLTAGLLELRDDIGCDVPAAGQLTHPNPHGIRTERGPSADPAHQVFDVTDDAAVIAKNRTARILVVTDPEDRIVTAEHQTPFVEQLRKAGREVDQFFVQADGPDHHGNAFYAAAVMRDCIRGAGHDEIAAHLADIAAKRLAARAEAAARKEAEAEIAAKLGPGSLVAGVNLRGADYSNFVPEAAEPALCQKACRADEKCAAWTYVIPGRQGSGPRCWLKSRVPPPLLNDCCTSGVEHAKEEAGAAK
jgi:dienelactone hydrolase